MSCLSCGCQHFVVYKNALAITIKKQYYHLFHKDLKLGYSICDCIKCKKRYICRENLDIGLDKLIPVEFFNEKDSEEFIIRANMIQYDLVHYTKEFVSNMEKKNG